MYTGYEIEFGKPMHLHIGMAQEQDGVGALWHGYEIDGLEHIPDEGPALLVAYHGTLPLDLYYIIAKGILYKKRTIHCVGDKFVFKMPGWGKICKVFCITPGTIEDCVATLNEGHLLIIAPGGVREALFSSSATYQIMWGKRLGFAKVVLGANVPAIPIFTENCRDAFRTPRWGRKIFRILYEKTRLPVCPIYGGFPVKMITHLGPPIYFNQTSSPEQVKAQVKRELTALIRYHQLLPGSILKGMLQRIRKKAPPKEGSLLRADQQRANGACSTESEGEFELSLNRSELPCIPLPDAESDFGINGEEDEVGISML
ncbi:acyltransferase domain-containing protein [Ditylenchus destructor]|uniref:Acyltransferase domain-containing protein n=1 Tax=Ditylenchus destructor TaxID=166010 RepID=A0AAD4N510_9BILA|nr:acyltransferase domain-containing protein [Ditylenchus destructor]